MFRVRSRSATSTASDFLDTTISLDVKKGKIKEVLAVLNESNINSRDRETGDSALHLAIAYHHTRISKRLLQFRSLDVNIQNVKGLTPLHTAILHRNSTAIKQLLGRIKVRVCASWEFLNFTKGSAAAP